MTLLEAERILRLNEITNGHAALAKAATLDEQMPIAGVILDNKQHVARIDAELHGRQMSALAGGGL